MTFIFLLGRLLFGGFFILNGFNHFSQKKMLTGYAHSKQITSPELAVSLSGAILLASGLSIVLGIFVPIALTALAGLLFVISFTMHAFWKDTDAQTRLSDYINFIKNMALIGACLMMLFIEIWPLSL